MVSRGLKNPTDGLCIRNLGDEMVKYTKEDLAFIKNSRAEQKTTGASLKGKICVISGATSGVGLMSAKRLAEAGAEIVLVARNKEKAEAVGAELNETYGKSPKIYLADFSQFESVNQAADAIVKDLKKIDILINSAGLHSTTRKLAPDGNEWVFQVNHLSSFLFTMRLLPLIKKSSQGRIIQVNSEGHRFGGLNISDLKWEKRPYIGLRAYGASKTAQMMTVIRLAEELKRTDVTINAMHPGAVKTAIGSNNGWLYRAWMKWVIAPTLKDPKISGEAVYYLAAAPELANTSGRYFNLTIDEKPMPHVFDDKKAEAVWSLSHTLTGLTAPV